MRRWLTCLLLVWFVLSGSAQYQFVKQWDKRLGGTKDDFFTSLLQTKDGGYLVAGSSSSPISGDKTQASWSTSPFYSDYWIVKIDSGGNKQWDKRYGGNGSDGLSIALQTKDGGYILGGNSSSGISGDKTESNWGSGDMWVVKIDSAGVKQWDKRVGGSGDELLSSIVETIDNGYILGGSSNSGISGDKTQDNWDIARIYHDMWVIKIDSVGNKIWDKRYGGVEEDGLYRILKTIDGGYLLGGGSYSHVGGDKTEDTNGGWDYWIVKIDSTGNKEWDKSYGGTGLEAGTIISQTNNGYLLGGDSNSPTSGDKTENKSGYWLVAIDSTGNKLWDKSYSRSFTFLGLEKTNDNGYLLSGISTSNAGEDKTENNVASTQIWIVKIDSLGYKKWDKTIFTTQYCEGMAKQTIDGCYVIGASTKSGAGYYKSEPNWDSTQTTYDYWLLKFCMEEYNSLDYGQQTRDNSQLQVWPTPFNTDLSLTLSKAERIISTAMFTITNTTGQVLYQQTETNLAPGYTKMLDLSYLPNGVYFVEVSTGEGKMVKRIIKQ